MSTPASYTDVRLAPDDSTAGASGSAALSGPRKGIDFISGAEPSPPPNLQPHVPLRLGYGDGELSEDPAAAGHVA